MVLLLGLWLLSCLGARTRDLTAIDWRGGSV